MRRILPTLLLVLLPALASGARWGDPEVAGLVTDRALDEMSDAAAHATLTFALTTSAVNGTDKGKGTGLYEGVFDYQGPKARR